MRPVDPRLVRRPRWKRDEDGNLSFWHDAYDRWQRLAGWTAGVLEGLEAGDGLAGLVARAERAGVGPRPERRVREFVFTLARFGYVEIPWDEPPAVYAGRYERIRELGRGGMGIADLARAPDGSEVVVKRAWDWLVPFEVATEALRTETALLAAFDHPGIVRAVEAFESEGGLHLVREFVAGDDLLRFQHKGVAEVGEAGRLAREIGSILAHVHSRGYILLDLRPANFLLAAPDQRVRLVDVGGCRRLEGGAVDLGAPVGSKGFMSPEVTTTHVATVRSDLWGFGRLLFFLATGTLPDRVKEGGFGEALGSHPFRDGVLRLTEEDPARRPGSAPEALAALGL